MPAPRGHRGTHANRGPAGYCVSVMGAAGGRQPSIALKTTFGRAAGLHSPLSRPGPARPRFTVGELRHRGEGSSSHACTRGRHWGRGGDVDGRRATEARRGRLPPPRPGPACLATTTYVSSMASGLGGRGSAQWHGFGLDDGPPRARPGPRGGAARVTSWKRGASVRSPVGPGRRRRRARPSPCGPGWVRQLGWRARVPGAAWSCWPRAGRPQGQARVRRAAARAVRRTVAATHGSGGARAARARRAGRRGSWARSRRARSAAPGGWRAPPGDWRRARARARRRRARAPGLGGARGGESRAPAAPRVDAPLAGRSSWPRPAGGWRWPR